MALEPRAYKACPPVVIDQTKQYVVTLKTTKGDIVIELFADKAPLTVNSFVFLAREGWFNNVPFHRVLDGFVAQAGDPSGTGMGNPGYEYINEIAAGLAYDKAGVVGMANAGADTNGSQFFITLAPATNLTGGYTIFGQVTEASMAVVNALTKRDPSTEGVLPDPDLILSVMIEEK
ncbi:MAG TPA: peptidylprolyl isomerase [Anaerolineaceae bacterium]|nr:peptidylprolyl isomerase [Anaerolineaceae bacterium]